MDAERSNSNAHERLYAPSRLTTEKWFASYYTGTSYPVWETDRPSVMASGPKRAPW
jgi:hypothetical protein